MGIQAEIPAFMKRGEKQMGTEEANASRLVTKVTVYSAAPLVDYCLVYDPEVSDLLIYCCTRGGKLYRLNLLDVEQKIGSKANSSGEDVFSDLLEDDGLELSVSTEPVYQLQSCDLVYDFKMAVSSLCVSCGLVAVTSRVQSGLKIQIYEENDLCEQVDANVRPFRILELELDIKPFRNESEQLLSFQDNSEQIYTKCLISEDIISTNNKSSDCLNVPIGLFKALVGQDGCLLRSPVILVAPPGGCLYFAPIKTLDTSQPMRKFVKDETLNSRLKLLCETTSDVILLDVLKIEISQTRTKQFAEMLCAFSQNGLVYFMGIHEDTTHDMSGVLQTWSVSADSPVLCACCYENRLYHSTGRYICETTVSFTIQSAMGEKLVPHTEVRRFQLVGAQHIAAYIPKGIFETDETACMLHCSHFDGRTTRLNTAEHFKETQPNKQANFANTMKQTLLGIEEIDGKKEKIDKELVQFEIVLKQINIAATLYQFYIKSVKRCQQNEIDTKNGTVPVTCVFKARLPDGENIDRIMLDCEITNQMPCYMSCDWSVMVTVEPTKKNEDCISRSFKLDKDFGSAQSFVISIPINPKLVLAGMTATVFFILQLSFKDSETVSLCVPVHTQSIDVLYFLYSEETVSKSVNIKCLQSSLIHEELQKIARTKPAYALRETALGNKQSSVCVSVNVCLKHNNITRSYGVNPSDPCSILNFLLNNSANLKKPVSDNGCYQTFIGAPVYLSVTVNQSRVEREITTVTVSIRADLATAAAVHTAVTDRLTLLSREAKTPKLQTETLKHKLSDIQDLEDELTRLQTDRRCQNISSLATVYEKLRKIATLQ